MKRLKKGDTVKVISGIDKGKEGKILKIVNQRKVVVENINIKSKNQKPSQDNKGGIIQFPSPIAISNLMLVMDGTPARVTFKIKNDSKSRSVRGK